MIAGRLHWRPRAPKLAPQGPLAVFEFDSGALLLTEAGSEHRASLEMASGEDGLRSLDAGGIEVLEADSAAFAAALQSANHTLKRALTDPRLFSGIGNAYSDEILHRARLSPIAMTRKLTSEETARLYQAVREVLLEWIGRLRAETGGKFPEKVTARGTGIRACVPGSTDHARPRTRRAGRVISAHTRPSTPSTAMPTIRNGSSRSHTSG